MCSRTFLLPCIIIFFPSSSGINFVKHYTAQKLKDVHSAHLIYGQPHADSFMHTDKWLHTHLPLLVFLLFLPFVCPVFCCVRVQVFAHSSVCLFVFYCVYFCLAKSFSSINLFYHFLYLSVGISIY